MAETPKEGTISVKTIDGNVVFMLRIGGYLRRVWSKPAKGGNSFNLDPKDQECVQQAFKKRKDLGSPFAMLCPHTPFQFATQIESEKAEAEKELQKREEERKEELLERTDLSPLEIRELLKNADLSPLERQELIQRMQS